MTTNYVKVRDSALKAIKRYMVISFDKDETLDDCKAGSFTELLKEQWVRFTNAQDELEAVCEGDALAVQEEARLQAEQWYSEALSNFRRVSKATAPSTQKTADQPSTMSIATTTAAIIQLPKMELPKFSGDYIEWNTFHDAFKSLIHDNDRVPDGQKLHYLRGCLRGEAFNVISGLPTAEANYTEAWQLLVKRYRALRVIVDSHFRAIFSIEKATDESAHDIKVVLDKMLQHTKALKAMGRPTEFWDDWMVHLLASKLPYDTRKQWELSLHNDELPNFDDLRQFLETRIRSLEVLTSVSGSERRSKTAAKGSQKTTTNALHVGTAGKHPPLAGAAEDNRNACLYCAADHSIYTCSKFKQMQPDQRREFVKRRGACYNCLKKDHRRADCRSKFTCQVCGVRHHTLLHQTTQQATTSTELSGSTSEVSSPALTAHTVRQPRCEGSQAKQAPQTPGTRKTVLLATALVKILDSGGRWQVARVLFDNGSHASFISEACTQRLRLPRKSSLVYVTGIGSSQGGRTKGETIVTLSSIPQSHQFQVKALILPKITNNLPTTDIQVGKWPHIEHLILADPSFFSPGPIDLLIGMDEMNRFMTTTIITGEPGTPWAQKSVFGWVLFGCVSNSTSPDTQVQSLHCDVHLTSAVSKFWELDEPPQKKYYSSEELFCEEHFDQTHRRAADGRFIVELPLKPSVPLGETRSAAERSFLRLERRLLTNDELRRRYIEFMRELLQLSHMEAINDTPEKSYYLPHHAVFKETSTTTKLRVVFNASMKSSSGFSLNDALMVGPQLQPDIFTILMRFRTHCYAMTADIEKMYRQVRVRQEHTDYQRLLWRESPHEKLQDYRLTRVTYGLASASFLAIKALQSTATKPDVRGLQAAKVVQNDFYMDDLLTGASSPSELILLQKNVSEILASGGFELRKWASNCKELIAEIPNASRQVTHLIADHQNVQTLGLIWNTDLDYLSFSVSTRNPPSLLTKRLFLADASTLYDPLGLVAPCTIRAKIWFQQVWKAGIDWDEKVPSEIASSWAIHRQELAMLSNLQIKRWLGTTNGDERTEFHIFADASERAYAAVVYARTLQTGGETTTTIVAARAKVAPLKPVTLPRLELCAAHLAAKLFKQVSDSLHISAYPRFAWTDSTVTLAWLKGHPGRWNTFVANRVAAVQEVLPPDIWAHVPSDHNPADCASRGLAPGHLLQDELWWHGPSWLKTVREPWCPTNKESHETNLEAKKQMVVACAAEPMDQWELLGKFSSYSKLKRVTAYLLRFVNNIRAGRGVYCKRVAHLTCTELREAEFALIKYTQALAFAQEIVACSAGKAISLRSNLLRLQPFLDKRKLLRVGGRIRKSTLPIDIKHPIVLPRGSTLAKLIVAEIHILSLHGGPTLMHTILQRRFWVIGARQLLRKFYKSCVKCARMNHIPMGQAMGDLPEGRCIGVRCFLRSAVDFAGPISFKFSAGRGSKSVKGYIAVFICMGTGAMHLELAVDLSSSSFLNTMRRFINRRGYCRHIYCDNGTNFVGADKTLRSMLQKCVEDESVASYFADSSIEWHFNPPSAPHMGGYWEAGVKRVKYHLKRALGDSLLTYEQFYTLLTEVEACLNSRPLCAPGLDVDETDALTPGHFIIGEPLKILPEVDNSCSGVTLQTRWSLISSIRQHFWRRWRQEYLVSLQRRNKWFRPTANIIEGDIVVLWDDRVPATKWKMAKVVKVHPGADGLVRVVTVKSQEGEYLRPIHKLSRLPVWERF